MPLQTFRNIPFLLNNFPIITNQIEINSSAQVEPYYDSDDFTTTKFNTNGPQNTSIRFNYFLTGFDPLYNYIESRTGTISGNIGGLFFRNGYLKSYNFNLEPNNAISINSEIQVFDSLSGSYVSSNRNTNSINDILDSSNVSFSAANGINLNLDSVVGLRFSFNNDLVPSYSIDSILPKNVAISRKNITCEIDTDSENMFLPFSGQDIGLNLTVRDKNNTSIHSFNFSGKLVEKNLQIQSNSQPINTFKIVQSSLFNNIFISGYSPTSGRYGNSVSISGLNMDKVSSFYFYDMVQPNFSYNGVNTVTAQVPVEAISGELGVYDLSNVKYRAGIFNVIDDGIFITGFSPVSGGYYL